MKVSFFPYVGRSGAYLSVANKWRHIECMFTIIERVLFGMKFLLLLTNTIGNPQDLTIKSILFNMQARSKINSEEKEEFR
jgi:hypothetical protein